MVGFCSAPRLRAGSALAARLALIACATCCCTESEPVRPGHSGTTQDREERAGMIDHLRSAYGFGDERVLRAMLEVPRHCFVPADLRAYAYGDHPLPIGWGQTISQPLVVATMTAAANLQGHERVLEVGTGSGYQAAVLSRVAAEVFSIEIVRPLGQAAGVRLAELDYRNVHLRIGDGYRGWPEEAPFDAILVTAAPELVPEPLLRQLKLGGRLVIPVGAHVQDLLVMTRTAEGFEQRTLMGVRFVPMTGEAREHAR